MAYPVIPSGQQNEIINLDDLGDVSGTSFVKGDALIYNGTNFVKLAVGANDTVLTAASAEATGAKWGTLGDPDGYHFSHTPTTAPTSTGGSVTTPNFVIGHAAEIGSAGASTGGVAIGNSAVIGSVGAANDSVAIGRNARCTQNDGHVAIGVNALCTGNSSSKTAVGANTQVTSNNGTAIGVSAISGNSAVAIGSTASANNANSVAIGQGSSATASGVAIGSTASISNSGSIAIGSGAASSVSRGIAIGDGALANKDNATAIGRGAQTRTAGSVTFSHDDFSWPTHTFEFVLMSATTTDATQTVMTSANSITPALVDAGVMGCEAHIVGHRTDAIDESAYYILRFACDLNGSTAALVGSVDKTVVGEDTAAWDATATINDTGELIEVKVTGEASKTIKWTCKMQMVGAS